MGFAGSSDGQSQGFMGRFQFVSTHTPLTHTILDSKN